MAAPDYLSEAIQSLPIELREKILKEFIFAKIRQKRDMGFCRIHQDIPIAVKFLQKMRMGWCCVHEELKDLTPEYPEFLEINFARRPHFGWQALHEELLSKLPEFCEDFNTYY